ncbi:MAG: hypothetical protein ACOX1X_10050 [Dethiobacteria bacterium]
MGLNDIIEFNGGVIYLEWSEVRKLYPHKFIKFEVLDYHIEDNKRVVDDVAVIKVIENSREAMREFSQCKESQFVYNTKHEKIIIDVVKHIGIRRTS